MDVVVPEDLRDPILYVVAGSSGLAGIGGVIGWKAGTGVFEGLTNVN